MGINRAKVIHRLKEYKKDMFLAQTMKIYMHGSKTANETVNKVRDECTAVAMECAMIMAKEYTTHMMTVDPLAFRDNVLSRAKKNTGYSLSYLNGDHGLVPFQMGRNMWVMGRQKVHMDNPELISLSLNNYNHFKDVIPPKDYPVKELIKLINDNGIIMAIDKGNFILLSKNPNTAEMTLTTLPDDDMMLMAPIVIDTEGHQTLGEAMVGKISHQDYAGMGSDPEKDLYGLVNVLLYAKSKNVEIPEIEYNMARRKYEKKLAHTSNDVLMKQYERELAEQPEYTFVEIDSAKVHYKPNKGDRIHNSPIPHWRQAHFHTYWKGPRDQEQEKVIHYIPYVWVGDPRAKKPKIIKLITKS